MTANRRHVKTVHTPEEQARLQALRDEFHRARPTEEQLEASGEYLEPVTMGEYFDLQEAAVALKQARLQSGLSLADVAARSGVDRTYISRIENGQQTNLTLDTLIRLAKAYEKRFQVTLQDVPKKSTAKKEVGV